MLMKKVLFMLLALPLFMAACSDDELEATIATISFDKRAQTLPDGSTDIKLVVSGLDASSNREYVVDLKCSGTATESEYELSSDHFVIGGANPVTTITVTSLNYSGKSKNLDIVLVAPKNFNLGENPVTTITMASQEQIVYNFLEDNLELKVSATPTIELYTMDGDWYYPTEDLHIPVVVNKEKSTAVLGEHFEFVGEPEFLFTPDDEDASVEIKYLKKEEGKDKIVLEVDPAAARYAQGDPGQCTITIVGPDYARIDGTWYVDQQPTDKNYMIKTSYVPSSDLEGFPEATQADRFTFDSKTGKLSTSLQSTLKNFFGASCNMKEAGSMEIGTHDSGGFLSNQIEMLDLDNCNRDFSASSTSQDKNAYIGIRLVEEQSTGDDLLELYLIDYKSQSFCLAWLTNGYTYNAERPTITSAGGYLLFYLKRVK